MSLDSAVARFRQRQADLFRDEATIAAPGARVFNPTTNSYSTPAGATRYAGPCLIRPLGVGGGATHAQVEAQETNVSLLRLLAKFPANTPVELDDVVTVTSSTYDAALADRSFVVVAVDVDGAQVSRRVTIEANLG